MAIERDRNPNLVRVEPALVLVRWRDAWFDFEHPNGDSDWRQRYMVATVGFVVHQDSEVVSVAAELLPDDSGYRAVTHIPRGVIEEIITLKPQHLQVTA